MKECDCLNTCGDDPALKDNPDLACDHRKLDLQKRQSDIQEQQQILDDAARYRFLRSCDWFNGAVCVVTTPKKNVRLGSDCPSGARLDEIVDSLRGKK